MTGSPRALDMLTVLVFWLLPIAAVLLAGVLGTRARGERYTALMALPESPWAPLVAGVLTAFVVWYMWGCTLHQVPVVHDEASYLLQAETFAHLRWSMPAPPLPAFFEQFHVFVTPTFASKYPPGHGILLVPGIWLRAPGLVPLLLNGLAGALLFALVRRTTNGCVAILTILLWLPMSSNLVFRPSYFSENTSSALWLLGWWALLRWRETERERWLIAVAGCVGWMAITRPLTAVAFAIPIGAVVLWFVFRSRQWRTLALPALLGTVIVLLLPVWSAKVTGSWRASPYTEYSKIYFPFDAVGFGLDTTPPQRILPPDMKLLINAFARVHAWHTVDHLPGILFDRWRAMFIDAFRGARLPLALFALVGLLVLPAAGRFAVAGSIVLTLCYLIYAHDASWDLYYLEIIPLFPFLTACGIWSVWLALGRRATTNRRTLLRTSTPQAALAAAILGVLLLVPGRADVVRNHDEQANRRAYQVSFATAVARLPDARTIVFIRYAPWHLIHTSLIANHADLPDARTWLVYDRGAENAALLARAPDRAPYLFDERSRTLRRLALPRLATGPAQAGDTALAAATRP